MSFKTYEQIQFATSIYVPRPFTWENYTGLWLETRFPLWLRNSARHRGRGDRHHDGDRSLSGYAVARLRFPGRESVASLILILYLVPPALLFIPLYRVLAELGATNSLSVAVPLLPDLHRALLHLAPHRLLQGPARRAGGGRAGRRRQPHPALVRVLLPLAAPGIVASAIFAFTLSWNEFLYALIFIQDETVHHRPGRASTS